MKELSELSVKGQFFFDKKAVGLSRRACSPPPPPPILHPHQGLIEKNNLGVSNVNMPATRRILGHYTLYKLLTFRSKLNINLLFCF